jgi:hypothetical protein
MCFSFIILMKLIENILILHSQNNNGYFSRIINSFDYNIDRKINIFLIILH